MAFKIKTVSKTSVPDERKVMESMTRLRHDMGARAKTLWVVIGTVIVAAAVVGGVYFMNAQAEQLAQEQLQQATHLYMNRPLNDTDAGLSHVRQAVELFQSIVAEYPKSSSAPLAMHLLANALSVLGDHEGAVATYQQFLDAYPLQGTLNSLVRQRLAYAYLEQGDLQRAERAFEKILTIDKAPNKDLALLELASLGEQQKQSDAAMARYQELVKGYPHSIYFSEASSRIRILGGGDGVSVVPSPASTVPELDSTDESASNP
ncbi:MAG TPA: tetratricopeptide repeat protein [Nitrospirales bacterium]|nr:tetratricopeptide repeat protein [Nitrospirales bacterium]